MSIPDWFVTGMTHGAIVIVSIFVFAHLYVGLTQSPARRRGGKYAGFVRHRAPVQFSQPRPQLTVMHVRCEWGLHLVDPADLVAGESVAICVRCKQLRDNYDTNTKDVA